MKELSKRSPDDHTLACWMEELEEKWEKFVKQNEHARRTAEEAGRVGSKGGAVETGQRGV